MARPPTRPVSQPVLRAARPTHPMAPPAGRGATSPEPPGDDVTAVGTGEDPGLDLDRGADLDQSLQEPVPGTGGALQASPATPTASAQPGDAMRTFTTRLPVDLRRRLRRHAINTDQTLEQVARAMAEEYLARHEVS